MRVARLKESFPTAKVELWCEDEHRLGHKPILRKVWSPAGERPLVNAQTLRVGRKATRAHLRNHPLDTLGPCGISPPPSNGGDGDEGFGGFGRFGGGVDQGFEQEAESGDVDLSFEFTNTRDDSNACAPALQFANSGNSQYAQGGFQYFANADDFGFDGGSLESNSQFDMTCEQTVQQSLVVSSN
jgi:hypothetical protein